LHFPIATRNKISCSCRDNPCRNIGKHPLGSLVPHGADDASADVTTINRWWDKAPTANCGIATGKISNIFAVDNDPRHGGDETLRELIRRNAKFPVTPRSNTGSGGEHFIFRHPGGIIKNESGGKLGPGLDIRGDGRSDRRSTLHPCEQTPV
jgi:hypothetical protein